MFRKMLVPVDGNSFSDANMNFIKSLAKEFSIWEIDFLYVINLAPEGWAAMAGRGARYNMAELIRADEEREIHAADFLSKLVERIKKEGIQARRFLFNGIESEVIADFIVNHGVGLIVINANKHYWHLMPALSHRLRKIARGIDAPIMMFVPVNFTC